MFRFRGKRKDSDEWVVGAYIYKPVSTHNGNDIFAHCIVRPDRESCQIYPSSLSISTGKPDSKREEIFASFPIDGVMTEGGDVVELGGVKFNITYSLNDSGFAAILIDKPHGNYYSGMRLYDSTIFTIIGKQGGGNDK